MATRQSRKRAHSSDDDSDTGAGIASSVRPNVPNKRVIAATSFSSRARTTGMETSIVAELDGVASIAGAKRQVAGGAFATTEIDTELDRDGRAMYEKQMALQEIARSAVVSDVKLYRGQAGYTNFIQKDGETPLCLASNHALEHLSVRPPCSCGGCIAIQGHWLAWPPACAEQRPRHLTHGLCTGHLQRREHCHLGWPSLDLPSTPIEHPPLTTAVQGDGILWVW